MMQPLTKREHDTLLFLAACEERGTYGPSYREIQTSVGLPSLSTAWRVVMRLIDLGYVTYDPHHYRSLRLARDIPSAPFDLTTIPTVHLRRELDRRAGLSFGGAPC
jgi:SOS-response transcriptional repressor LexA